MPSERTQRADASRVLQVRGVPRPVSRTTVVLGVSASMWKRLPSATMRTRLMAPTWTSVRRVFSSIVPLLGREELRLLGDGDADGLAVPADQPLDQVGDAAVLACRGNAGRLLQVGVHAQVEGAGLAGRHGTEYGGCNGDVNLSALTCRRGPARPPASGASLAAGPLCSREAGPGCRQAAVPPGPPPPPGGRLPPPPRTGTLCTPSAAARCPHQVFRDEPSPPAAHSRHLHAR